MMRDYRIYRCQSCDNVWVTEETFSASRCGCCRSTNVKYSIVLPKSVALEMLRRNTLDTTFNITKVIEDSSVKVWERKAPNRNEVFEQQVHLMVSLYTILEKVNERENQGREGTPK